MRNNASKSSGGVQLPSGVVAVTQFRGLSAECCPPVIPNRKLLWTNTVTSTFSCEAWTRCSSPIMAPPSPIMTMGFSPWVSRMESARAMPVANAVERPCVV